MAERSALIYETDTEMENGSEGQAEVGVKSVNQALGRRKFS
jgi:hypothetical protein